MSKSRAQIYMDYAAASPLDPRALKAMLPYLKDEFGNPSSIHQFGQRARRAIDDARFKCMELLGAFSVHEILFTGSGTESCNMAIFGAAFAPKKRSNSAGERGHLVVSAIEHPAVLEAARYLRDNFDFALTEVLPNEEGVIELKDVEAALRPDTVLISIMLVNNEVGSIQAIKDIATLARSRGILMHTDACQAPGYTSIRVEDLGVDLLSLNGSKIHGPKGVGLLYVREGVKITPLIHGGGQEFRMRGGTESPALIVGFAKALELALDGAEKESRRIEKLRDLLLSELLKNPKVSLNGPKPGAAAVGKSTRVANNISVHVEGRLGETLVMRLDLEGLAASSGSACSSGKTEPSHVLLAMGQPQSRALESLRLTLGRPTTSSEVKQAIKILKRVLN